MICECPPDYTPSPLDETKCIKNIIIENIECPSGCELITRLDGSVYCSCENVTAPTIIPVKNEVYFDNKDYFEEISWTVAYKPTEGTWNSYFSFYPDYSPFFNNFFQIGYNWGEDKGTLWNHLLNQSSFAVFQGKKHTPIIDFVVPNENVTKILNSIALNIEARNYTSYWDWSVNNEKSFKNLVIYNSTNNSGLLEIVPQKGLQDLKKYPQTENNIQKILYTSDSGKQSINYFFNRVINQSNNIPLWIVDRNNIFKTINNNAVNFKGKRVLERLKGEYFNIRLEGIQDTRFNLILKNVINNETIY